MTCKPDRSIACGDALFGQVAASNDNAQYCNKFYFADSNDAVYEFVSSREQDVTVEVSLPDDEDPRSHRNIDLFVLGTNRFGPCCLSHCLATDTADSHTPPIESSSRSITFHAEAGARYYFAVDGYQGPLQAWGYAFDISVSCE